MGTSTAETLKEIEETRGRLEEDIHALEERLPAPALLGKRVVGIAAGGGAAGSIFWFVVRRARKKRAKRAGAEVGATGVGSARGGSRLLTVISVADAVVAVMTLREVKRVGERVSSVGTVRPLP